MKVSKGIQFLTTDFEEACCCGHRALPKRWESAPGSY